MLRRLAASAARLLASSPASASRSGVSGGSSPAGLLSSINVACREPSASPAWSLPANSHRQWTHRYATTAPPTPPGAGPTESADPAAGEINPSSTAAGAATAGQQPQPAGADAAGQSTASLSIDDMAEQLQQLGEQLSVEQTHAKEAKDQLLRSLADMENLRQRSAHQIDTNRKFAVQGFVKQMLDVADNLERAAGAVPAAALGSGQEVDPAEVQKQLRTLLEGVKMTQQVLNQAFRLNGVEPFRPEGETFDPNQHEALFQLPDPSKEPGTVGVVTKTGYRMHDRVLRAAEVGVVAQR